MAGKTLTMEIPATEAAKYEAEIGSCLEKIDRALERSKQAHAEIARLKKLSRARLARWQAQTA